MNTDETQIGRWRGGFLGSARVSRAGDGVLAIAKFSKRAATFRVLKSSGKIVAAGRRNQHARRARYPINANRAGE